MSESPFVKHIDYNELISVNVISPFKRDPLYYGLLFLTIKVAAFSLSRLKGFFLIHALGAFDLSL